MTQLVKNPAGMQEIWVRFLGWEDSLEKGKATHSSILAWPVLQRVGHDWATFTDSLNLIEVWSGLNLGFLFPVPGQLGWPNLPVCLGLRSFLERGMFRAQDGSEQMWCWIILHLCVNQNKGIPTSLGDHALANRARPGSSQLILSSRSPGWGQNLNTVYCRLDARVKWEKRLWSNGILNFVNSEI